MTHTARGNFLLALAVSSALAASCVKNPPVAAPPPHQTVVALLPDPENGVVGRATVTAGGTTVTLANPREATTVDIGQSPSTPGAMTDAEVQRTFGEALASLPLAPIHFTLYYELNSDQLTPQSRLLVPQVLDAVKRRPYPDVTVIGHTDTIGSSESNRALGLKRAEAVRALLIAAGLKAAVTVRSHGESDLLVQTADNVAEPRNRRVEITVR